MNDAPALLTERLELWRPRASDRAPIEAMLESPAVRQYLGPLEDTPAQFARLLRNAGPRGPSSRARDRARPTLTLAAQPTEKNDPC